jgi:hypothetical protein
MLVPRSACSIKVPGGIRSARIPPAAARGFLSRCNSSRRSEGLEEADALKCLLNARLIVVENKTDAEGQGTVAYLSRETMKWLEIWLEHAKISEESIFRRFIG